LGELIDLRQGRRQVAARRGFSTWNQRFGQAFNERTSPGDLPDTVLLQLIQRDQAGGAIDRLVLGILGSDRQSLSHEVDPAARMAVLDITLFVLDQLRFEAMRRLGWVVEPPLTATPLLGMVEDFQSRYAAVRHRTPALAADHPGYRDYLQTFEADRGAFIRRLTPQAMEAFEQRVHQEIPPTG